jgi:hypothetical protein
MVVCTRAQSALASRNELSRRGRHMDGLNNKLVLELISSSRLKPTTSSLKRDELLQPSRTTLK